MLNSTTEISEDDYEKLVDGFDTMTILGAVDGLDELRADFADDDETCAPMSVRDDLLKLHELAMNVVNMGGRSHALEMFDLASDIEMELSEMVEKLEAVRDAIGELTDLRPDDLYEP